MLSRLNRLSKPIQSLAVRPMLFFAPKASIRSNFFRNEIGGYSVREIENDKRDDETDIPYYDRSRDEFNALLESDTYYVYLHKSHVSILPETGTAVIKEPGHIAGFLTDKDGRVIPESVMSLRNNQDKPLKGEDGERIFLISSYMNTTKRYFVYDIDFLPIDRELSEYFFNKHQNTLVKQLRYLYSIKLEEPLKAEKIKEIKEGVEYARKRFTGKHYKLLDGYVHGKFFKALNCINGFMTSNYLEMDAANPQTHLAVWSFLNYFLNLNKNGVTLKDTTLYDDQIKAQTDAVKRIDNKRTFRKS